ncbi:thioredoxin family protein [Arcticibacterium luteifluviistationis]|uniref:Thioredoxin family protein n=1 Tax=Arcticibacterium luteifluviistationis TaxID=1784714 RepID=A0A2Z4GEK0_9BACT|nr:thioredoxin family protein [Arcticibacterium luteifluviistationis]AWV99676.1 thioredoxin family protein [Arcticibacterium luteifluviistationis]
MKKKLIIVGFLLSIGFLGTCLVKQVKARGINIGAESLPMWGFAVGDEVSDFKLKNVDGKMVSLSDFSSAKGFILVFTCNHCPFSKAYEERLVQLNGKFSPKGFPLIAINPNDPEAYEEDNYENMKKRALEKGFTFPYLVDDKGVAKSYGVSRNPQAFVVEKVGGKNIVRYIGAIDDSPKSAGLVSNKYVEEAIENLLVGKPVVTQNTRAIGCAMSWRSN